ncbi:SDR family NAD(P)-dependent oxidoreductase [Subtercola boreus]|uniref:Short-chain dehydrogenase n=1 Tax=Subtercola boreus TaxID=120213 RepID=A0A3E0WEZ0_9MICO|nr:SDR family NAD(P)-dependent oxidoreductase [Subtercola boreus]RFA21992.1 short-chain dehydrogenase [Subtercola boreus]RFA22172.1 short-chain dehydrogenase [Subtercola boreus]RFA28034.1 short-chain dehydrogenase [Subtercola boreus]
MTHASPVPTARLSGRRVVVTGGARGIGASIARRFRGEGADVAILDLLEEQGRATAAEIGGTFHRVDLSDEQNTRDALGEAMDALSGIDVLVNNAGILRFAPLLEISVADWDAMFQINTRAMLVTTQVAAKRMIAQKSPGKIINMASMGGKTGGAGQGHYAASKAAVIALTRVTALELGAHSITANCLCPGYVLTEMGAATRTEADIAQWSSYSPLGRLAQPDDVAGVAAFLASPDADYLTGQSFNVTGGMIMH